MANLGVVPLTILLKNLNLPLRPPYLGALDMKDGFGTLLGKMRQYFYITFPFQLTLNMDPTDKNKSRLELWIPKRDVNSKIPYKYVNFLKSDPVSLCYLVAQFNKLRYHFPS